MVFKYSTKARLTACNLQAMFVYCGAPKGSGFCDGSVLCYNHSFLALVHKNQGDSLCTKHDCTGYLYMIQKVFISFLERYEPLNQ